MLIDAINKYTTTEIVGAVMKQYPDQEKNRAGYIGAVKEMRCIPPVPSSIKIVISLHAGYELDNGQREPDWWGVYGDDGGEYTFALEFMDWAEWLGSELVVPEELQPIEALAHVVFEMTFNGYSSKDIAQARIELFVE